MLLRPELGFEVLIQLFGAAHLQGLGRHHRPREDRKDDQDSNDGFAFRCGVTPHVKQIGFCQQPIRSVH